MNLSAFLPHCCKQHTLRRYTGPVDRRNNEQAVENKPLLTVCLHLSFHVATSAKLFFLSTNKRKAFTANSLLFICASFNAALDSGESGFQLTAKSTMEPKFKQQRLHLWQTNYKMLYFSGIDICWPWVYPDIEISRNVFPPHNYQCFATAVAPRSALTWKKNYFLWIV